MGLTIDGLRMQFRQAWKHRHKTPHARRACHYYIQRLRTKAEQQREATRWDDRAPPVIPSFVRR